MNNNWSEKELLAAVKAYVEMHRKEAAGIEFTKRKVYADLADKFDRTAGAFEYRMQNISYVYSLLGRNWVSGLKPAKNVGPLNLVVIERLINTVEGRYSLSSAEFESAVSSYLKKDVLLIPQGVTTPESSVTQVTTIARDPKVKAWVLQQAQGQCECCDVIAPFTTLAGEPYLEVHHLIRLADGGPDMVSNVVAVCPNCHRRMHYGIDKYDIVESLYGKIGRLG